MTDIDRLANTGELLLEKITSYLNEDIPVIVENATESWPDRGLIDVVDLKKVWLYTMLTHLHLCNLNPLQPHFYTVKLKFTPQL